MNMQQLETSIKGRAAGQANQTAPAGEADNTSWAAKTKGPEKTKWPAPGPEQPRPAQHSLHSSDRGQVETSSSDLHGLTLDKFSSSDLHELTLDKQATRTQRR